MPSEAKEKVQTTEVRRRRRTRFRAVTANGLFDSLARLSFLIPQLNTTYDGGSNATQSNVNVGTLRLLGGIAVLAWPSMPLPSP